MNEKKINDLKQKIYEKENLINIEEDAYYK